MYKKDPSYSEKAVSLFMLDLGAPQELPDALRGEAWSFVQLPLGVLQEELESVTRVSTLFQLSFKSCFLSLIPLALLLHSNPICSTPSSGIHVCINPDNWSSL